MSLFFVVLDLLVSPSKKNNALEHDDTTMQDLVPMYLPYTVAGQKPFLGFDY